MRSKEGRVLFGCLLFCFVLFFNDWCIKRTELHSSCVAPCLSVRRSYIPIAYHVICSVSLSMVYTFLPDCDCQVWTCDLLWPMICKQKWHKPLDISANCPALSYSHKNRKVYIETVVPSVRVPKYEDRWNKTTDILVSQHMWARNKSTIVILNNKFLGSFVTKAKTIQYNK